MIEIEVTNLQSALAVDESRLTAAAEEIVRRGRLSRATISLAVVDNTTIHELNRRHLEHDFATDVLSFSFSCDSDRIEGEVIVSADMAVERADSLASWSARDELLLYVVHGVLHLVGFDDATPDAQQEMRRQEREVLASLGVTLPEGAAPGS